jgi:hypothetical protein
VAGEIGIMAKLPYDEEKFIELVISMRHSLYASICDQGTLQKQTMHSFLTLVMLALELT